MKKAILSILTIFPLLIFSSCTYFNKENINSDREAVVQDLEAVDKVQSRWSWFIDPGEFKDIKLFNENFIGVQNESGKYGFINKEKELIVDYQYFNVISINEGIARVLNFDKKYLYIDSTGKEITNSVFVDSEDFREGFAAVKNDKGKWGFINKDGKLVINYQFDNVLEGFNEGFAAVALNDKWSFIDKTGSYAFAKQFDDMQGFSSGYAGVKMGSKWGFINQDGDLVIQYEYEDVGKFSEDKAAVKCTMQDGDKWAYINKNNEIIIDFKQYDSSEGRLQMMGEFKNGYAPVTDILYCLMDSQGEIILGQDSYMLSGGTEYNSKYNLIAAYDYIDDKMVHKKFGFINLNGTIEIPFIFEHVSEIHGDLAQVLYNNNGIEGVGLIQISEE